MSEFIDLTPTWSALLPGILRAYESHVSVLCDQDTGRVTKEQADKALRALLGELARMAEAADKWNEYCSALNEASGAAEAERINEALGGPLPIKEAAFGRKEQ